MVRSMGPNKTIQSISRICKAVNGVKEIVENFQMLCGQKPSSVEHSKVSEDDDLLEIMEDLEKLDQFTHSDGRKHESFPDTPPPKLKIVAVELKGMF